MRKPNDMAKECMAKAAEAFEKMASAAEVEADLWKQAAQHARNHNLVETDRAREQAIRAHGRRDDQGAQHLAAIATVDTEFFGEAAEEVAMGEISGDLSKLNLAEIKLLYEIHRKACGKGDTCRIHQAMKKRIDAGY